MHFRDSEILFGHPIQLVQDLVKRVDAAQYASSGVLERDLQLDTATLLTLAETLTANDYLTPYLGALPKTHHGECLPEEAKFPDTIRSWHVTDLGKRLAKAFIGEPLDRSGAELHLENALARIADAMSDPNCILKIESAHLCGSLLDATQIEFGDVDILIQVSRDASATADAALQLETRIKDGDIRLDVMVYDGVDWVYPVKRDSPTKQLLPQK